MGERAYRYRLYPSRKQEQRLVKTIETTHRLWNDALSHRKERWERERKSTSYALQQAVLTEERRNNKDLASVHSQVCQDVLHRLDRAFDAFFEHRARYPRFKTHSEFGSFTYPQAYNGSVRPDSARGRLSLSKIGAIRAVFHRSLPDARVRTCTVVHENEGKWYASLVYDDVVPLHGITIPESWKAPVGIDLGLRALVTTSDGETIQPPRYLRKAERRLKRLQRSLSRKRKGSRNRWKARKRVATLHAKIARQRADFNHKLSSRLVGTHDLVVFEDLRVGNMVKNRRLAKSISDAGWNQLTTFANYKATKSGKRSVNVPAAYTTQECWYCGELNEVELSVTEFQCSNCYRPIRRDVNAARIVLKRGIETLNQVGQDRRPSDARSPGEPHHKAVPELKPVETGPLPVPTTGQASPVEEAGTICGGVFMSNETHRWKPRSFSPGRMSRHRDR